MGGILGRIILFFIVLIIEIAVAMTLYVVIKSYAPPLFITLQGVGSSVKSLAGSVVGSINSGAAETASVQLFGDLSDNAMVLLILGLFASGLTRGLFWSVGRMMTREH